VLLAFFTDIHANRQAFWRMPRLCTRPRPPSGLFASATTSDTAADPEWTVETVMGLVDRGALGRARQPRQRGRRPDGIDECRSPGRDRVDTWQAERDPAAFSGGVATRAAGGGSALRSFRSKPPPSMALCAGCRRCGAQHRGNGTRT